LLKKASAEVASAISSRSEELTHTSGNTEKPWLEEMTPASVSAATEERPQMDAS
jgi:cysteine sulfinate desulfinase/cysteine desulfurase-like protein